MRTALLTIATAASALAFAAPASAQYYPQPRGYAYGYQSHALVQRLDNRAERVRRHVYTMYQRRMLTPSQARNLDRAAVSAKQRIWRAGRNGISRSELRSLDRRLDRLERQVRQQVARNSRYAPRGYYGYYR